MDTIEGSITPTHLSNPDELTHIMNSPVIDYESISEGFGISSDGIDSIIERLHQSLPSLLITNGHILAVLISELAYSNVTTQPLEEPSMQQKIDQIAQAYYWDNIWQLLESLAHCLRMVEIAYTNQLKKQSSRSQSEFFEEVVTAVRPACKLCAWGYPEATQMLFRRLAELGVTAEEALNLTLQADRSSLSPFTIERSLLETTDN